MIFILAMLLVVGEVSVAQAERFVSLKSGEGNVRAGPDHRYYRIKWVLLWEELPVEVIQTSKQGYWYYIRDWKGNEGWIHRHYFSSRRTVIVTEALQSLYGTYSTESRVIARVEEGVIGILKGCRAEGWCRARFQEYDGWMPREALWGVSDRDFETAEEDALQTVIKFLTPLFEIVDQIGDIFQADVDSN